MVASSVPLACHSGANVPGSLFFIPTSTNPRGCVYRKSKVRMYTCCVGTLYFSCAARTFFARQDAAEVTGLSAVYRKLQGLQTWHKRGDRR